MTGLYPAQAARLTIDTPTPTPPRPPPLPPAACGFAHMIASLSADGQLYGRTLPTQSQRAVALHKQSYTYVFSRLQSHTHR